MTRHDASPSTSVRARALSLTRTAVAGFALFALGAALSVAIASPAQESPEAPAGLELIKEVTVPGDVAWTDTGLDVEQDDELVIKGTGVISLQRGNPTAFCGPDGYNMKTAQQPLMDKNIGALVARVVKLISIETDPDTKKVIRHELVELLFVGSESRLLMPISGRLFLGPNENVVGDNSGQFKASIFRIKKDEG
jgi:hypothetical protein